MEYQQKDIINKLLPADDLYWSEEEGKYIALSPDEIDDIVHKAFDNGFTEEDEIIKILSWATTVRVGELLFKNFLKGQIAIRDIAKDGEPMFVVNFNGNN